LKISATTRFSEDRNEDDRGQRDLDPESSHNAVGS
jgi:hypothetical protein